MGRKVYIIFLLSSFPLLLFSQKRNNSNDTLKTVLNNISSDQYIHHIDSLIQLKIFEKKSDLFDTSFYSKWDDPDFVPEYPDMFYEFKMEELNKLTPINLEYNEFVKANIVRYTVTKKKEFEKIKGLSYLYFPIMEEYLQKYGLPLELKYISVIESSLNPLAKSKSGAVGLWQFLLHSGKLFDLEVTSYIDERKDPYKSTDAACRYLKYLYKTFNNWELAIAAYNGGPGEVRNAIIKSGGKTDFWEIKDFMREETQNYVPKFVAANYVMNYYYEHNIRPQIPAITYFEIDTVQITNEMSFKQITEKIDISMEMLQFLNPEYILDHIPDLKEPQVLVLPAENVTEFLKKINRIYAKKIEEDDYMDLRENAGSTEGKKKIIYVVKKGEFFHKIAVKHNCSIENIKAWNNLTTNSLYPGQKLVIWIDEDIEYSDEEPEYSTSGKTVSYIVQKGDTLWAIAEKFKCKSIQEIIKANELDENGSIKPGQELKIPVYQ